MSCGMNSVMQFGKYKGLTVSDVLKRDPGWMCWIRDEKRNAGQPRMWDDEVTARLDGLIMSSPTLRKKYKPSTQLGNGPFDLKDVMQKAVKADAARSQEQETMALAYEGIWGSW